MKGSTKAILVAVVVVILALGAYVAIVSISPSSHSTTSTSSLTSSTQTSSTPTNNSIGVVNFGYYANINHAPAVIGVYNGDFQKALGPSTQLKTFIFSSGPTEMTALLAGKLDMAVVGPSPAVNAYVQSNNTGLVILSGVSTGGAVFVVRPGSGINSTKDLGGKTFAEPGLGNTQDVAFRYYLLSHGFKTTDKGGNVTVQETTNSNIVTLFATGKIDGAWVPQPYGEILIKQYGGTLLLDERSLWPGGQFSTAELVVRTAFLQAHADVVKELVGAEVSETLWIQQNPAAAENELSLGIAALSGGQQLNSTVLTASLQTLNFTFDPLEQSVLVQAQHAYDLGFLTVNPTNSTFAGLYDLTILNTILQQRGIQPIQ